MTDIWTGAARTISPARMGEVLALFDIPVDPMRALLRQEAAGRWFTADGSLPRRFEPHKLPKPVQIAIGWQGNWRDAFKIEPGARGRLFSSALIVDEEATLRACSWGGPQIMGFHHRALGYDRARSMVLAFADDAEAQLRGVAMLIVSMGLASAMRAHDWRAMARYNGTGRPEEYARGLEACYRAVTGQRSAEVLRRGSQGESVKAVQQTLGLTEDGEFGPETEAAVRLAQERAGVPVDGVVGAVTYAALRSAAPATAPMPAPRAQETTADVLLGQSEKAVKVIAAGATVAGAVAKGAEGFIARMSPWAVDAAVLIVIVAVLAFAGISFARRQRRTA
jgi:hypothetical protein